MSSALAAAESALFDALAAGVEGAPVYQDVPEDAPAPLVVLGDMKSEPLGAKGDADRRITATVIAIVGAEERAPLLELQRQIEALLDESRFAVGDWTLATTFIGGDAVLGEDGATYIGTSDFEILALTS